MHTLQAIITGAIQGLSEFLPISSSAHIIFSNELYNLITNSNQSLSQSSSEDIFFNIIVHLATLFAVLIYFFKDIKKIISDFVLAIKEKNYKQENFKLVNYIFLSTIITGLFGYLIKEPIENLISNPQIICFFLFTTGLILLFSEKMYKGNKKISFKIAIFMSLAQALAVFPGFSRSGMTIATGLFNGLNRSEAARFSFLMSIPIIFLASFIYPLLEIELNEILTFNFKAIIAGFITSFIVGYLCIKYFMKLLGKLSLKMFAYYCFVASILMFLVFQVFYHQ